MTSQPVIVDTPLPNEKRTWSLWTGVLGAPALWGLQLQGGYTLVPYACSHDQLWLLHAVTAVFFVATLATAIPCWVEWGKVGRGWPRTEDEGPVGRIKFLAAWGVLSSGLFSLAILAQGLASFFLSPCWD